MAGMPSTRDPQTESDWSAEAAEQEKIAAQIESDAPVKTDPQIAGTSDAPESDAEAAAAALPKVTLRTTGFDADAYPVGVGVVGLDDGELVFESESDTHDVTPQVAEQVVYLDGVEVVA